MEQILQNYNGLVVSVATVSDEYYGLLETVSNQTYCHINGVDSDNNKLYRVTIAISQIVSITQWYDPLSDDEPVQKETFLEIMS